VELREFMRTRVLIGLFVLLVAWSRAFAQAPRERVDLEIINKIKEEGQKRSQVMDSISFLTDVYGPRLTGSPQIKIAAEWTKERLTKWGLKNAHLEPWGPFGRGWSLEGFTINMVQPTYTPLIACPKAWSPSTPQVVRGRPIYFEVAKEEDLEKYRGKLHRAIVFLSAPREVKALFDPPARRQSDGNLLALANGGSARGERPQTPSNAAPTNAPTPPGAPGAAPGTPFGASAEQRAAFALQNRKWQMLYDEKPAVIIEPGRGDGGTLFVTSATMPPSSPAASNGRPREENQPRPMSESGTSRGPRPWQVDAPEILPQVVMAVEHYNRIVRMIQKEAPVELEIDIASRYHADDLMGYNVVAEIPGGDLKDELVMLGAHFDSWHSGTGATDNAVGCGVALEAVRILKSLGVTPRRTVRLALWTGEEQGLLGSKAYVTEHFGRAITPPGGSRGSRGSRGSGGNDSSQPQRPTKYELKAGHEKFCAYFNLDNGTGKIRGVYMQGNEAVRPIFRAWLAPFADLGAVTLSPNNTGGTDHLSYDAVGLPGFQFIQDPLEYDSRTHHSNMDVFDRVQAEDMQQAAIVMASFVYHAAMRDEKLPRKPLVGEVVTTSVTPPVEVVEQGQSK
jgi:hypothetical protein